MAENSIKVVTTKKKMTETACTSLMNVTPKNHYCSSSCWSEREKNLGDKMGFEGSVLKFLFVVPPELLGLI